jgi:hypothetical protein
MPVAITKCPPSDAFGMLKPEPQFANNVRQPVSATFDAHGVATSTGISFGDYQFMQTTTRAQANFHRTGVPAYALDTNKLREVITRAVEIRAGLTRMQLDAPLAARLAFAQNRIVEKRKVRIAALDGLCSRYMAVVTSAEQDRLTVKQLQRDIESLDTTIRIDEHAAAFIAAILYLSYRVKYNATQVGSLLGLKADHVRQVLARCNHIAKEIESGLRKPHACRRAQASPTP